MKIINQTHWRNDHLRAFAERVARDEFDPKHRARVIITFTYTRSGSNGSSGCAFIGGRSMTVRLHRERPDKVDLAHVIAHEMAHIRGMKHWAMQGARYNRTGTWREIYAYAEAMPLERKPAKAKPTTDQIQQKRYQAVLAQQKAWTTKAKRATTALRKLRDKQRYYERIFEQAAARRAAGIPDPEPKTKAKPALRMPGDEPVPEYAKEYMDQMAAECREEEK